MVSFPHLSSLRAWLSLAPLLFGCYCFRQGFTMQRSLPVLGHSPAVWTAQNPRRPSCLCLFCAGIKGAQYQFFLSVQELHTSYDSRKCPGDPLHFKCSDYTVHRITSKTGCRPLHGLGQLPSRKMPVHATILTVTILTICIVAQYSNGYIDTVLPRHTHPRKQTSKGYIMYHNFCASQIQLEDQRNES